MSKKSRTLKKARAQLRGDARPVTKVKDAGDAIAMIPYLLGFTPADSIVVQALVGPRNRFGPCFRLDLAAAGDAQTQAEYVTRLVDHHRFGPVMILAFSDQPKRADPVVRAVLAGLGQIGVSIIDAVRADGDRWWSYVCADPSCCSPHGTSYDVETSRVAAEAVLSGLQRAPDRESLRAQFDPDPARRAEVGAAVDRLTGSASYAATCVVAARHIDSMIADSLDRPEMLTAEEAARLALAVQDLTARDRAWMLMTRANADRHFALWRFLMRSVPDAVMPPVGSLAAFAAWLSGHGVLASHAVERVQQVRPEYPMARLIADALEGAVSPLTWDTHLRPQLQGAPDRGPLAG